MGVFLENVEFCSVYGTFRSPSTNELYGWAWNAGGYGAEDLGVTCLEIMLEARELLSVSHFLLPRH